MGAGGGLGGFMPKPYSHAQTLQLEQFDEHAVAGEPSLCGLLIQQHNRGPDRG
jgi:hypothetical protein